MKIKVILLAVILSLVTPAFAMVSYLVVGKLSTDSIVKQTGQEVTVVFTVENMTNLFWTPTTTTPKFQYKLFRIDDSNFSSAGDLTFTQEQYVGPNSSTAFAIGKIALIDPMSKRNLCPGNYRIQVFAVPLKNTDNPDIVNVAASAAIQVNASGAVPKYCFASTQ